ncbi:Uu.00g093280.m01.CDS01 [Anthostomella pinea]|uniref:Uu.00g093280.m01.CDS01 n=1 Tax=Anthostomella pinea TaxID=933095 RepID=A0AAI8VP47_9PEZI|nr:Uu.00g093280.m01.CDS01 [Anthostomella pinea]
MPSLLRSSDESLNGHGSHDGLPANGNDNHNGHPTDPTDGNGLNGNGDHNGQLTSSMNGNGVDGNGSHNGHQPSSTNGDGVDGSTPVTKFEPVAICGMACRLPGGIKSPQGLWEFLLDRQDGLSRVPGDRYNTDAWSSRTGKPGATHSDYGYFISDDLLAFDSTCFNMSVKELERCDPNQRLMLLTARECADDAGEADLRGKRVGVYVGCSVQGWSDMYEKEVQNYGTYHILGLGNVAMSNRVSYEMDLKGPSMTIGTACASSLSALNEACKAIAQGDCDSAIVGGATLIIGPVMALQVGEQGALAADGSCKTFSADSDGYGRGEAVNAVFLKPLSAAIRDGNPVRAVIRGIATNHNGRTAGITMPDVKAQEALIRQTYEIAGISDPSETPFVEEFSATVLGLQLVGDPIETTAIGSAIGGDEGTYIGSIKPNLGHSEGASGLTSLIKSVLSLENQTIPPNIKFNSPNPKIPFAKYNLTVPVDPIPWPAGRKERVSINNFGIGGVNGHVVLESARSFNVSPQLEEAGYNPQLLAFSASSSESLTRMADDYTTYLAKYPERIEDVAYTLANKREHKSHRGFIVASREKPGTASPPVKPGSPPNIVMVFTGQGAQWPQMGRDLLRSNKVFKASIKAMDDHLKSLGATKPKWTIEGGLKKPARTSQVAQAELSQPLCTAIQVALVDCFKAVGIEPRAVVGHSSGEIAGAYAAGALSAQEAIVAAFHRGAVAKQQNRAGAMAAIGMSWKEVDEFLVPNVGVACENSPRSVTISGDADKVEEVFNKISKAKPDVLARLLKVDKAYHSYHMAEIGNIYFELVGPNVHGKAPTKLFFSSVEARLLNKNDQLGAKYWQKNLESPVLFKDAISEIARHSIGENAVFLEIGPHSALAGPLRQILSEHDKTSPYIASMMRGQNCTEAFLSAVGRLYALQVPVDFAAMYPTGVTLPGLPTYPWNNTGPYWHETRVMKDWRQRQFKHHDLLGLRTLESTDFEPVWRNLFHLDNAPWIRDHIVNGDIVFPFANYIAMAGEAIRQVTGVQQGFRLRDVNATTALVVHDTTPVEIVTSLRRRAGSPDSQWWDFNVTSHNGHVWVKHFSGEATALSEPLGPAKGAPQLPRTIATQDWYETLSKAGFYFGPAFRCLDAVKTSSKRPGLSTADVSNAVAGEESNYHMHPTCVDNAFQMVPIASLLGLNRKLGVNIITSIKDISVTRCHTDVTASATGSMADNGSIIGYAEFVANGQTVLRMSKAVITVLGESGTSATHNAARPVWRPHMDFADLKSLLKPVHNDDVVAAALDDLATLSMLHSHRIISEREPAHGHLCKFQALVSSQVDAMKLSSPTFESLEQTGTDTLFEMIKSKAHELASTPAAEVALAISEVAAAVDDVFSAERDALDVLNQGGMLDKVRSFINDFDNSAFFQTLAHMKPNLRVLELGAGSGSSTGKNLQILHGLYSKYTCTDAINGLVSEVKERYKNQANMEFIALDVSKDLDSQGFSEDRQYDLILATNILHQADSLSKSLVNIRSLLHPQGRLLLQELAPGSKWINYVMGMLPSWWRGATDGQSDEPCVAAETWESELRAAGFGAVDSVVHPMDSTQVCNVIVARAEAAKIPEKQIALLTSDMSIDVGDMTKNLVDRGYNVSRITLGDEVPAGKDIVALLDQGSPFFKSMKPESYNALRKFILGLGDSSLFWVTQLSVGKVVDPHYAEVIGFARVMRTELDVDFAVCQSGTDFADGRVIDVFEHFQKRVIDENSSPEMEYVIIDDDVNVSRYYPFSLPDEQLITEADDEVVLATVQPGRLNEDLNNALGSSSLDQAALGLEAAGVVRRVGPRAQKLQIGDRVVVVGQGGFATSVTRTEQLAVKIPDNLSFQDAATMPIAFVTAVHSVMTVGGLEKSQFILIHNASSDVGIAAIQLAQMLGAEVLATVRDDEEAQYLVDTFELARGRIFSAHDASFAEGVLRETNGDGVDLALSSVMGDMLHETWRCVAEFGRMVEIGRSNGAGKLDMGLFAQNRSYCAVDVEQIIAKKPSIIARHLESVMRLYGYGSIAPIQPAKVFPASEVLEAFDCLKNGTCKGKVVVGMGLSGDRSDIIATAANRKIITSFDRRASYILVGGLGGIGRQIAIWLAENGAGNLIFLSRSAGKAPGDQDFIRELEAMGVSVQVVQGSVTSAEDVTKAVSEASHPVKGVLQMSMVLRDRSWSDMTYDDWRAVAEPKIQGTWNLHNATVAASSPLDFFILFSSISSVAPPPGQANYAAANGFLDAFTRYRAELGLPASTLQLGVVEGVGVMTRNEETLHSYLNRGYATIRVNEILDAMSIAVRPPLARIRHEARGEVDPSTFIIGLGTTSPLSSPNNRVPWRRDPRMAVYHNTSGGGGESGSSGNSSLKAFMVAARSDKAALLTDEATALLAGEIGRKLLAMLGRPADELNTSVGLSDLGMDSLVGIEMRKWWKATFGFEISLLEMLGMGTLEVLGRHAAEGLCRALHGE